MTPTRHDTVAGLRAWAAGGYPQTAAVELLARAFDARFTHPGLPWIATRNDRHFKSKTRRRILWRLYRYQKDLLEPLPSPYLLSDIAQLHAHIAVLDSRC